MSRQSKLFSFTFAAMSLLGVTAKAQKYQFRDTEDFIKKYQSKIVKINRDSLAMLPPELLKKTYMEAKKLDARIQIDTVVIKNISDGYYNFGYVERGLNLIVLKYFILHPECNYTLPDGTVFDQERARQIVDDANADIPNIFIHELGHLEDMRLNIGALTPAQIAQFEFNSEIRARLKVMIAKKPKARANDLVREVLDDMDENYLHYAINHMPRLIGLDMENALQYQKFFSVLHMNKEHNNPENEEARLKNFDEIFRTQYSFDGRCILDEMSPRMLKRLLDSVKKYISVPELQKFIKEMEETHEASRNIPHSFHIGNISKTQKFDALQQR